MDVRTIVSAFGLGLGCLGGLAFSGCETTTPASHDTGKAPAAQADIPSYDAASPEYVLGINMPWVEFGRDFGDPTYPQPRERIAEDFRQMGEGGVDVVRFWIHCDGRGSPLWEAPGVVEGMSDNFIEDFRWMLDEAAKNGIAIMPCLWSFDMAIDRRDEIGPNAGIHEPLVESEELTERYIQRVLKPLVEATDSHPALYAWEICNEPEWMIENEGVPLEDVQRWTAQQAAAIHRFGDKPVTNGSAGLKFHSDVLPGALGNYWSDAALQEVYPNKDAYLDFYQVHVYGWLVEAGFDPFSLSPEDAGLDKPTMIGEAPGEDMHATLPKTGEDVTYTPTEMYRKSQELGYFGLLYWSYNANDGHGDWPSMEAAFEAEE
ncbi:MAG: hypothetical protein E1N59_3304 [Puniceicoccaceae bacterium 5H]|nr:MAG: hypothetical protein E1N59_3304 [Puniceicoccaceae bacterium 5H]